jgi:hypothetical protein
MAGSAVNAAVSKKIAARPSVRAAIFCEENGKLSAPAVALALFIAGTRLSVVDGKAAALSLQRSTLNRLNSKIDFAT